MTADAAAKVNQMKQQEARRLLLLLLVLAQKRLSAAANNNVGKRRYRIALLNGGFGSEETETKSRLFASVRHGWKQACAKHQDMVECFLLDENHETDNISCTDLRRAFYEKHQGTLDGIALQAGCPGDEELAQQIKDNSNKTTLVVTIDQDLTNNTSHRLAFIGTHPETLGQTMAKLLRQLVPDGGTYALIGHLPGRDTGFINEIEKDNGRSNKPHWHSISSSAIDYTRSIPTTNTLSTPLPDLTRLRLLVRTEMIFNSTISPGAWWKDWSDSYPTNGGIKQSKPCWSIYRDCPKQGMPP